MVSVWDWPSHVKSCPCPILSDIEVCVITHASLFLSGREQTTPSLPYPEIDKKDMSNQHVKKVWLYLATHQSVLWPIICYEA